jgi:cytochrome b
VIAPRVDEKEYGMNWNRLIRQGHRWLSIAFTIAVIFNIVAMTMGTQAVWVGLLALFPLILLLISGLYLFALPYVAPWRAQ